MALMDARTRIHEILSAPDKAWQAFDPRALAFCKQLAANILKSHDARSMPALMALAFWFRDGGKRNLEPFLQDYGGIRVGRGIVLHITPANVDTVFMYSCLISLLMGNINFVRVSERLGKEGLALFDQFLLPMLAQSEHEIIARRLVFFSCPRNDPDLKTLSERCQQRVIWGGDETIKAIRAIPLNPRATEICFPDRFSFSLVSAQYVTELDDTGLRHFVNDYLSDIKMFGQQACSSPRIVLWLGTQESVTQAKQRFWSIYESVSDAVLDFNAAERMARLVDLCTLAALEEIDGVAGRSQHYPYRGELARFDRVVRHLHGGRGLMLEKTISDIESAAELLSENDQTITVAGLSDDDIACLVDKAPHGAVQRIVNVGHALDFYPVWDGQNLPELMSRVIPVILTTVTPPINE
jgi:hypothetical protein